MIQETWKDHSITKPNKQLYDFMKIVFTFPPWYSFVKGSGLWHMIKQTGIFYHVLGALVPNDRLGLSSIFTQ